VVVAVNDLGQLIDVVVLVVTQALLLVGDGLDTARGVVAVWCFLWMENYDGVLADFTMQVG